MKAYKPPISMLVDSMTHYSFEGEGDYNKPIYADGEDISFIRIDRTPKFTASLNGEQLLWNAKVFCYNGLTTPFPKFKEQDKLVFDGKEHIVISANMFKEPFEDSVYSWELAVV